MMEILVSLLRSLITFIEYPQSWYSSQYITKVPSKSSVYNGNKVEQDQMVRALSIIRVNTSFKTVTAFLGEGGGISMPEERFQLRPCGLVLFSLKKKLMCSLISQRKEGREGEKEGGREREGGRNIDVRERH